MVGDGYVEGTAHHLPEKRPGRPASLTNPGMKADVGEISLRMLEAHIIKVIKNIEVHRLSIKVISPIYLGLLEAKI